MSNIERALREAASTCIHGTWVTCLFSFVLFVAWRSWQRHIGLNHDSDAGIFFVAILVLAVTAVVALVAGAVLSAPLIFTLSVLKLNAWYLNIAVGMLSAYLTYLAVSKRFIADPDLLTFCLANGFVGSASGWYLARRRPLSLSDIAGTMLS